MSMAASGAITANRSCAVDRSGPDAVSQNTSITGAPNATDLSGPSAAATRRSVSADPLSTGTSTRLRGIPVPNILVKNVPTNSESHTATVLSRRPQSVAGSFPMRV